jgi:lipoprotein-anchoring transpeptidase ErfK/SrfK
MSIYADTITPTGTYHIFAKESNTYLTGSDQAGSWDDHVYYWMPFLDNQYGTYGLHDATWRAPDQFGNISPDSPQASNGCVELPLATAQWLYHWVVIGTTVTIND